MLDHSKGRTCGGYLVSASQHESCRSLRSGFVLLGFGYATQQAQ